MFLTVIGYWLDYFFFGYDGSVLVLVKVRLFYVLVLIVKGNNKNK